MKKNDQVIKVGVGLMIFNLRGEVLLGLRKSPHGQGSWCPPGGHLEYGESFEQAAARECLEETGLLVQTEDLSVAGVTNDFFAESGKQYVTVVLQTSLYRGEPEVLEPQKCEKWQWFPLDELPQPLFLPMANFLKKYRPEARPIAV